MKCTLKVIFAIVILAYSSFNSTAQRYTFKNYTVADGLGSSSVNHIFQDSKGYIWFATQGGGASKFNGKEFITYTKHDGLVNNDVTYITEDRTGNIWIATADGVSCYNGNTFKNYNTKNGLTGGVVYCIYADAENKIWFATQTGGIKMLDGKKINPLSGLLSAETYTLTKDKQNNLYIGTAKGIAKYTSPPVSVSSRLRQGGVPEGRGGKIQNNFFTDKTFFSSMLATDGNVWFGSTTGDVVVIHSNGGMEKIKLPAEVANDFIGGMAEDKQKNIWIATGHGLLKYNRLAAPPSPTGEGRGEVFQLFGHQQGLSVNVVQSVLCDYENNIWAGTLTGGVNL